MSSSYPLSFLSLMLLCSCNRVESEPDRAHTAADNGTTLGAPGDAVSLSTSMFRATSGGPSNPDIAVFVRFSADQPAIATGMQVEVVLENKGQLAVDVVFDPATCIADILDEQGWPVAVPAVQSALVNNPSTKRGMAQPLARPLGIGQKLVERLNYGQLLIRSEVEPAGGAPRTGPPSPGKYRLKLRCVLGLNPPGGGDAPLAVLTSDEFEINYGGTRGRKP